MLALERPMMRTIIQNPVRHPVRFMAVLLSVRNLDFKQESHKDIELYMNVWRAGCGRGLLGTRG